VFLSGISFADDQFHVRNQDSGPTTAIDESADDSSPQTGPETWVDRHGDCLYRYALLRLREPELASELVQETFLEALRGWEAFEGRSSERTWLVGILKHRIVDHLRRVSRERALSEASSSATSTDDPAFDARGRWKTKPDDWRGEPGAILESREFWDVFGSCLSRLPRGLADAFFLREVDGLSGEETRELLKISSENLWTRLHRARSLLRDCLERNWFGETSLPTTTRKPV
jgi:RNA polymerase sigma-70 factor (ECF subfamily)